MTRQILLDVDDVLLNWIGGFAQYAATRLQNSVVGLPDSWNMGEWLGTTNEAAFELIEEFNVSVHFGRLVSVDGSQDVVHQWMLNESIRLHAITSCSSDRDTVKLRQSNLARVFGPDTFDSVHCLDLGTPKFKILQAWKPGAVWVEDNYKNAMLGVEAGHTVFIRTRPHNKEFQVLHDDRLTWFDEWSELEELIDEISVD